MRALSGYLAAVRILWGYALIGSLAISGAAANEEIVLPQPKDRWIEVHSANFVFFSDAGIGPTKRIAVDLEELRAVLAELGGVELETPVPTFIYVFRNDRSFRPFKPLDRGDPETVSGIFWGSTHSNYIAINADSSDASGVVFHEYVHDVTAINMRWLPLWFSEGLAEFYQTFEVVDDTAYIGLPIRSHVQRLGVGNVVPFSTLVTVDTESPYYNESGRKRAFYAQSWALTHYLLLGDADRRQQLDRYLLLVKDGATGLDAFTAAFGNNLTPLEVEVVNHFRRPRLPFIKEKTETDVDKRLVIKEMPYADVLYRLGELLANQTVPPMGSHEFFMAALEADPEHSQTLMAVALQSEEGEDWAAAEEFYKRALSATPTDPEVLFRWGDFLRRRGTDLGNALIALQKSTQLNPAFGPGWRALALVYAELPSRSPEALSAAETAHRLQPADMEITEILLRLHLNRDSRQSAVDLVEDSLQSNPIARAQGWSAILLNDLQRVREFLLVDGFDEAKARIGISEPDIDRTSRPESIRHSFASAREIIAEHHGAGLYDEAKTLLDEGRPAEARELLELALADLGDSAVARACRHLVDVIDHPENYTVEPGPRIELSPTRAEITRLNELLAAGDMEAAHSYLLELRDRSAGIQGRWLEDKILEIEKTLEYNRYVDGYNGAVDSYNEGDFQGAVDILERLLSTPISGYQADSARALLADARAALGNN